MFVRAALLAASIAFVGAQSRSQRVSFALGAESPPRGVCIWEREPLWSTATSVSEGSALEHLSRHALRHGWSRVGVFDGLFELDELVEPEHRALCPRFALDSLASMTLPFDSGDATIARIELAWCLARNERCDEALALLDEMQRSLRCKSDGDTWNSPGRDIVKIAEAQARIALRAWLHEASFDYAAQWHSSDRCGNAARVDEARIEHFRTERLLDLGRWNDVQARCIDAVRSGTFDVCLGELWIDSFVGSGSRDSPESLVATLQSFAATPELAARLESSLVDWEILQLPLHLQLTRVSELSPRHCARLLPLLRSASAAEFEAACAPIFDDDLGRALRSAEIVARSGRPHLDELLDSAADVPRANQSVWREALDRARSTWTRIRARIESLR